jgi:hypothetical protein
VLIRCRSGGEPGVDLEMPGQIDGPDPETRSLRHIPSPSRLLTTDAKAVLEPRSAGGGLIRYRDKLTPPPATDDENALLSTNGSNYQLSELLIEIEEPVNTP